MAGGLENWLKHAVCKSIFPFAKNRGKVEKEETIELEI